MKKRDTLLALLALGAAPFAARAQQAGKVWRIGYPSFGAGPDGLTEAFREQLRTLGYVEGRNLVIESRTATDRAEDVPELIAELVRLKVDVIVARSAFITAAAKRATSTIPIVMTNTSDPVGNITGMSSSSNEIAGKRLQLLREIVPKASRVAALAWGQSAVKALFLEQMRTAAQQLGITLWVHEVNAVDEFAATFDAVQKERAQCVIVQFSPIFNNNRRRILELAAQRRLPMMFETRNFVDEGGLVSYGASLIDMHRRAAVYVDKILKGAKPADLPVELPTKFEMVINLKTAKALGLSVPQSVLLQADEVIK